MRFIVLLLLLPLFSYSQTKIEYDKGKMEMLLLDDSANIIKEKQFAEYVTVTHNKFYQSYHIYCTTENGYSNFDLEYNKTCSNGAEEYYDNRNDLKKYYYVDDESLKNDTIALISETKQGNYTLVWRIYDLHIIKVE